MEPPKIPLRKIEFRYWEGYHPFPKEVASFAEAAACIRREAHTAPDTGAYDKVDFRVIWTDGEYYDGRFDLKRRHTAAQNPIGTHIYNFAIFYSGRRRLEHVPSQEYARLLRDAGEVTVEAYGMILDRYELGTVYPGLESED